MSLPPDGPLQRRLGPLDAAAIVVSNVIGGGIFFVPILVAGLVPNPRVILVVWFVGGVFALFGATAYAELAAFMPHAGGEYVYLREAFGPLAGFLSGWTSFVAGFSGAIAASAVALVEYLGRFVPLVGDATPLATLPLPVAPLVLSAKSLTAVLVVAAITFTHFRGLGPGRVVQNALTAVKVLALVAFIVIGFTAGHGSVARLAAGGSSSPTGFLLALVPVMFTYSGWNAAAYVAEEVRAPTRNVPLALGLGTLAVMAVYLGLNALYLFALPLADLQSINGTLIDTAAARLFDTGISRLIAAFTIVSIAASISAMVLAGPRVYFAMARDGLFLRPAARVHARFHAPTGAILAQAIWSGILVLSGTLVQLVSYTGFAIMLFSSAAVAGLFVLRRRHPAVSRPFRAWGYPWAPAAFVMLGMTVVANEVWRDARPALAGLAIIGSGIPIYFWLRYRQGSRFSSPE